MTDPRTRPHDPEPSPPDSLHWLSPAFAAEDPDQESVAAAHAFRIHDRWFLIPIEMPAEVSPRLFCARLPFTRSWCLGLANVRGELVPVYDLGALIRGDQGDPGDYFLMLGQRDARACLCIDEISVIRVPADAPTESQPPLPNLPDDLPCQGLVVGTETYAEIDIGALLRMLARTAGLL